MIFFGGNGPVCFPGGGSFIIHQAVYLVLDVLLIWVVVAHWRRVSSCLFLWLSLDLEALHLVVILNVIKLLLSFFLLDGVESVVVVPGVLFG